MVNFFVSFFSSAALFSAAADFVTSPFAGTFETGETSAFVAGG